MGDARNMDSILISSSRTNFPIRRHRWVLPAVAALALGAVSACDSGTAPTGPEGSATIQVLLTDAPSDMLDSAHIWISRVYLTGGGGTSPDTAEADTTDAQGRVDLFNDPANPLFFDVLTLRDGVTADLTGLIAVNATSYQGIRFVVDSTRVTLADGFTFEDGTRVGTMKVPSGMTSGIKVKIKDLLELDENDVLTIVVDLDVDSNFNIQMQGNNDSLVRRILFSPVLHEKSRNRR